MTATDQFTDQPEAAVGAALASREVDLSTEIAGIVVNGQVVSLEQYDLHPSRKKGTVAVTEAAALIEYVNRHRDEGTSLWSDWRSGRIVAVLDDHDADTPGWAQHRATFTAKQTEDWQHWAKLDGKLVPQATFAEHVEDGIDSIRQPTAAEMLELAQFFHAKNDIAYKSAQRLDSGETQFRYEETTTAKAGQKADLSIPTIFTLGLAPFDGTEPYRIDARFRYRLNSGDLTLGYKLVRPDLVLKSAFGDVVTEVQEQTGLSVLAGTPRS